MNYRIHILNLFLLANLHQFALAETFTATSDNKPVLIELFSSEGCSSCPPAEKQIGQLVQSAKLWKDFVPVNFHVDYWNQLGWVDPYSNALFTERQRHYARKWKAQSVYTPAFVNDGVSIGPSIELPSQATKSSQKLQLALTVSKDLRIETNSTNLAKDKKYSLHIAVLGNGFISDIKSGENSGRKLTQNFAVLSFQTVALTNGKTNIQFQKPSTKIKPVSYSLAAWVTETDSLTPVLVLGGDLKSLN